MLPEEFYERLEESMLEVYKEAYENLNNWNLSPENLEYCQKLLNECKEEDLKLLEEFRLNRLDVRELIERKLSVVFKMETIVTMCHGGSEELHVN